MKHQICIDASEFVQAIKDASSYAGKTDPDAALGHVILTVLPKLKKLAVMACDGLGYYERRLNLEHCKKQPKPSLPGKEMRLGISLTDIAMLVKFISTRTRGNIQLDLDDEQIVDGNFSIRLTLPNGTATTFFSKARLEIPDLSAVKAKAEKGKKKAPTVNSLHLPVRELLRASRVFTGKCSFAQMFTTDSLQKGVMALLECKTEEMDISVIFMLNNETPA